MYDDMNQGICILGDSIAKGVLFDAQRNRYAIAKENIGKQITVTVTETDDSAISVSYGPMNYIERMSEKGTEAVKALVNALYNYYKAAKAYTAE